MRIIKKKIDYTLDKEEFFKLLNNLNENDKEKILKYKKYEDSLRSLYGKLLLKDEPNLKELNLSYNKYGKPYLKDKCTDTHFNISHSGEWVVLAIDTVPIGIDIQEITNADINIAKRFFSKEESEYIFSLSNENQIEAFFKLWSLKEAYVKAEGRGLSIPLNSFTIDISSNPPILGQDKNLKRCELYTEKVGENYFMSICRMF